MKNGVQYGRSDRPFPQGKEHKMKRNTVKWLALLLAMTALLGLFGCRRTQDEESKYAIPDPKTNRLMELTFTSLWYMNTVFELEDGIEFKNEEMLYIVALFNDLDFERAPTEQSQLEDIYMDMMDAQYIILEGAATMMIGEDGRVLLTKATGEIFISKPGSFDPQGLRDLVASLNMPEA